MEQIKSFEIESQAKFQTRGSGVPERTRSHYFRILALLRQRGSAGVLASELYDNPKLYGRSPRNRISELRKDLRKDGFSIPGEPRGASDWFYCLKADPVAPGEQLSLPAIRDMRETVARVERDDFYEMRGSDSPDWFTEVTRKPRPKVQSEDLFLWERHDA